MSQEIFDFIKNNQFSQFTRYLEDGGDTEVRHPDHWQETPLFFAAMNGRLKMVEALLAKGANPLACDEDGETCLMAALRSTEHTRRLVELFMDAGVDPHRKRNTSECGDAFYFLDNHYSGGYKSELNELLSGISKNPLMINFNRKAGHILMEEIYLFDIRERVTCAYDNQKLQAMSREAFSSIAGSLALRDAYNEHVKRGGTLSETDVFGYEQPAFTIFRK